MAFHWSKDWTNIFDLKESELNTRRHLEDRLSDVVANLFFLFLLEETENRRKASELSTRRHLEDRLPDVVANLFLFLLEETVQIGGKSEISRQRQLEVRLPDVVYFCSRKLCKSAEKVRSLANIN